MHIRSFEHLLVQTVHALHQSGILVDCVPEVVNEEYARRPKGKSLGKALLRIRICIQYVEVFYIQLQQGKRAALLDVIRLALPSVYECRFPDSTGPDDKRIAVHA